jgi:hypothetical protein
MTLGALRRIPQQCSGGLCAAPRIDTSKNIACALAARALLSPARIGCVLHNTTPSIYNKNNSLRHHTFRGIALQHHT